MSWHHIPKDDAWKQGHLAMLVKLGKRAWLHCDDCRHSIMIERTSSRRCVLSSHCNGRQQKAARRTSRRKVRASGWETHHEEHEEADAACKQDDDGAIAAPIIPATDVVWHVSRPQIAVDQYGCRRPRQQHEQEYPVRDVELQPVQFAGPPVVVAAITSRIETQLLRSSGSARRGWHWYADGFPDHRTRRRRLTIRHGRRDRM